MRFGDRIRFELKGILRMKHFKTKHSYHDAYILGYSWNESDLILKLEPCEKLDPSEVRFLDVKNRQEVTEKLEKILREPTHNSAIFSIDRKDKQRFVVCTSISLEIICQDVLEL